MKMRTYKKHLWLTGLVSLLLLLAACGAPGFASTPPTPAQTIQNSAKVMSQLKSVHMDLQGSVNLQSNSTSSSNSGLVFNVSAHGDFAAPDQVSAHLALGQTPLVAVIVKGQTVYVQTQSGVWYSLDKSQVKDPVQSFFSQSVNVRVGQIMAILQQAKLSDEGIVSLNGRSVDHIVATFDQQTLQKLNAQLNALLPAPGQNGQNQITQASLDLWIDQSTGYLYQAQVDAVARVNNNALQKYTGQNPGNSSTGLPVEVKAQLNFSKFNQPVNIQAPANATPLQF